MFQHVIIVANDVVPESPLPDFAGSFVAAGIFQRERQLDAMHNIGDVAIWSV